MKRIDKPKKGDYIKIVNKRRDEILIVKVVEGDTFGKYKLISIIKGDYGYGIKTNVSDSSGDIFYKLTLDEVRVEML